MRAITYTAFGPADTVLALCDIPTPDPAAGEVLVRLHRSGVNPSDVKSRAGSRPGVTKPPFPLVIPHSDGAGVIEATGPGVDPARKGERVWIWNGQWQRPHGTAATHIAIPAAQAVPLPDGIGFDTGATLGIPGLTAAQTVLGGGDIAGKTLLVSGGAGSVGHLAIQLARWAGARVIATASPGTSSDHAQEAGADTVLDYRAPDLGEQILAANDGHPVDRAIECEFGPNIDTLAQVMAPLSTIAAYGSAADMTPQLPFGPLLFKAIKIDITLVYILPDAERAQRIKQLHDALTGGALLSRIHTTYPLDQAASAHIAVEQAGRHGAILLDCT
ncbi:NADPH:quinone reductase [Aquicoccus porphyridii]|uniref:NADPH:quinone reductase n=1 Tax=Aquicoccus porphyridii TaxID=1852029 RepID=A0A5A9ZT79_9RHOB|nr:NADPH:quinone reductase [Aquicoccus porphyridii]KAA0920417.1 NADPH:quinone reductase [Aquicoccus porphyridii]RAI54797.1 NADPH:quinone reductase [Rhodobacteraceae bacterium AsT-22]